MPRKIKATLTPQSESPTSKTTVEYSPLEVVKPRNRKIIYEKLKIVEYSTGPDSTVGPMMPTDLKLMLGWETEKEFQARKVREDAERGEVSKPEHHLYGDFYHCLNTKGEKVRCRNNGNNRPFSVPWMEEIREMVLKGQYAGPYTIPGETVNGETLRISRYGEVLSGQHQGSGCILADELLQEARAKENPLYPKYPFWVGKDHCFIETILITGLSDDERVLRTIDYVKPRTPADMLFTMSVYRDRNPFERREMTRMLASAVDLLWQRTATKGYKTHPEIVGF